MKTVSKHWPMFCLSLWMSQTGCADTEADSVQDAELSSSQVTTYQQLASDVQASVASYQTSMMSPQLSTLPGCQTVSASYDAQVRPWISQMMNMSGAMERFMDARGAGESADLACTAAAMMAALDRHHANACASSDLSVDRAEAVQHAATMAYYAMRVQGRCGELTGALDGGAFHAGPMMAGCSSWNQTHHFPDGGMPGLFADGGMPGAWMMPNAGWTGPGIVGTPGAGWMGPGMVATPDAGWMGPGIVGTPGAGWMGTGMMGTPDAGWMGSGIAARDAGLIGTGMMGSSETGPGMMGPAGPHR